MHYSKLTWVLLLVTACLSPTVVRPQLPGCYIQEINLVPCLMQPNGSGNTTEPCCRALNQALSVGYHCLCSLLGSAGVLAASTNALLDPLVLALPGCALSSPPLSACQAPLQQLNSPLQASKKPVLIPVSMAPDPNSTQTGKQQLVKEMPRPANNIIPILSVASRDGSSGGRRKIGGGTHAALLCFMAIGAWIL